MIKNAVETIKDICLENNPEIILKDRNRYRISVQGGDSVLSYIFSVPVRRKVDGEIVDSYWRCVNKTFEFNGTSQDSVIQVSNDSIVLKKPRQRYSLFFGEQESFQNDREVLIGLKRRVEATMCGVKVSIDYVKGETVNLWLEASNVFFETKSNSQYFSFMEHSHRPYVSLSVMFFKGVDNKHYPLELISEKQGSGKYSIRFIPSVEMDGEITFEFNLYEEKVILDTTVSSKISDENNAFGSTGFIGGTERFGSQWLYSKVMLTHIDEYYFRNIESIRMLIPKLSDFYLDLESYVPNDWFCSFGSTWENKVTPSVKRIPVYEMKGYVVLDLFEEMSQNGQLKISNGTILKTSKNNKDFCVLATGDCYSHPQILEIKTAR